MPYKYTIAMSVCFTAGNSQSYDTPKRTGVLLCVGERACFASFQFFKSPFSLVLKRVVAMHTYTAVASFFEASHPPLPSTGVHRAGFDTKQNETKQVTSADAGVFPMR